MEITINKNIYGHFAEHLGRCIYEGFWVGEDSTIRNTKGIRMDVVEALKKIKIPILRWPGGCFADEYHWQDGIGVSANRPKMINTHWGGEVEDNSFGTHEFLDLCELLDTEPYICGNVGSGSVNEMSKWIEYLNFNGTSAMAELRKQNGHEKPWNVKYWGVGNENWGCGGHMTADYYADQYRRYATYARNYGDTHLRRIAGGPNSDDYHWMETLMKKIPFHLMWGVSLHYYTTGIDWNHKGPATGFDERIYFSSMKNCLFMEELITKHGMIMDQYDPHKKIALVIDEWGIWTDAEPGTNPSFLYQQNTLRDALIAATTLNIFNNHAARIRMANLAQTVNVLQALILTDKEKMILTPTYHVFDMYQVHQDAILISLDFQVSNYAFNGQILPSINASASRDKAGRIHVSAVNIDPVNTISVKINIQDMNENVAGQILTSRNYTDHNTFSEPEKISLKPFYDVKKIGDTLIINLPALSIVLIEIR